MTSSATVTHPFVSAIADGGDATLVQPSNWNASHTVSLVLDLDEIVQGQDLSIFGTQNLTMQNSTKLLFAAAALLSGLNSSYELVGTLPSSNFRLHYKDCRVTAMNDVTIEGSADLVVLDLVPGSNLSLRGVG